MEPLRLSSLLEYVTITILISRLYICVGGSTTVTSTAPVNPVEADGIFSLRCEVLKMKPNQEMAIFRTINGQTKRLSLNDEVLDDAGDRVYLAVRQMNDGSTVYLLSIMKVTTLDEGIYLCKIFDVNSQELVSQDSLKLQVMYVPGESDPDCANVDSLNVIEGKPISLNCSSEIANPAVDIQWSRTGGAKVPETRQSIQGSRVYLGFTFQPTLKDHNVVFLCEISSPMFPEFAQTCHIGPFQVYRNPNIVHEEGATDSTHIEVPSLGEDHVTRPKSNTEHTLETGLGTKCHDICSSQRSPVLYWIIATIVACFLTILFFIMGIILVLKFRRLNVKPKPTYYIAQHPMDDIYTELECRRGDSTVYMSLGKSAQAQRGPTLEAITDDLEKQYEIKQTI